MSRQQHHGTLRTWRRRGVLAVCGIGLALGIAAACGDDDDTGNTAVTATTISEPSEPTSNVAPSTNDGSTSPTLTTTASSTTAFSSEPSGDSDVTEDFCDALSAQLDAVAAVIDSYESTGATTEALVGDARDANNALRDAAPDALADEASAVYTPIGDLLDGLASGESDKVENEYAAILGSPDFTEPLTDLVAKCSRTSNG